MRKSANETRFWALQTNFGLVSKRKMRRPSARYESTSGAIGESSQADNNTPHNTVNRIARLCSIMLCSSRDVASF